MNDHTLFLGTAKVDISPREPIQLAGFASRGHANFDGIDSPIHIRCFYFRNGRNPDQQSLVVIADLLCFSNELAARWRNQISRKTGIPEEAVILHATHNHSGPSLRDFIDLWELNPTYIRFLEKQIENGADLAMANAEEVKIERGDGSSQIAVNRRKLVDGRFVIAPNFDGPSDSELIVIRFTGRTGRTKAIWLHYACHPVVSSENRLSYEYCGAAVNFLEEQIGGDAIAGFLQGCCGDVNPYWENGQQNFDTVRALGDQLAEDVGKVLRGNLEALSVCPIRVVQRKTDLPYRSFPSWERLHQTASSGTDIEKRWASFLIRQPEARQPAALLELTRLDLADNLSLLFMNGEMVVRYGFYIKEQSGRAVIPIAYTNGMVGYVTTAEQLEEGGYEPVESAIYFGLPAPFDEQTESAVLHALDQTMQS
ncbi:hypothetical protein [Cohnella silvisoli]|uniref:Neutral/alkaline non-lysosomal ceramidase N-terminal domain-containing protein n=1 Tax=Cohnella silvisoli TaxID=2873699 RepID=A0ABV1KRY1_9BACL|nr:hypothetical protein [Cohnella silvisoli]MCD9022435.1 hypothetical protein [Cohnella silvisoli]